MSIRGIKKTSLIDYPGKIAPILFFAGCNLRCRYCHNSDLAMGGKNLPEISDDEVISFLKKRKPLIDGVSITGGEPTLSKNLIPLLKKIKELSLPVKLDSNGLRPDIIRECVENQLIDYIAVDIKTSPEKYNELTGKDVDFSIISGTIDYLKNSEINFEARTVCIPEYITMDDLRSIRDKIKFVKKYYLQQFVSEVDMIDPLMQRVDPYPVKVLEEFLEFIKTFSEINGLRGV